MKNVRKLEAVHTLNKSVLVFHTQNNQTKLRHGRCTT